MFKHFSIKLAAQSLLPLKCIVYYQLPDKRFKRKSAAQNIAAPLKSPETVFELNSVDLSWKSRFNYFLIQNPQWIVAVLESIVGVNIK